MMQVIIYGFVASFALFLGAIFGLGIKFKQKTIAGFMAFGAGVLICALTFGLMEEAFNKGGFDAVIIGFVLGGICFIAGNYLLYYLGGRAHKYKQTHNRKKNVNGELIVLGSILDGIPESIALGVVLFGGGATGILMLSAIFLSNFPEGISSVNGLLKEGFSKKKIFWSWFLVAIACFIVVLLSYYLLNDIHPHTIGILEAFAAGAILAMLSDSMMPEAYENGGYMIAFLTILGFLMSFLLSRAV